MRTSPLSRRIRASTFALGLLLPACGGSSNTTSPKDPAEISAASAARPFDNALGEAVRAYLRTFHLDEKTLPPGLTIPFVGFVDDKAIVGGARATGKVGPQGHQVYEMMNLASNAVPGGGGWTMMAHQFIEVAPE